MTTAKLFYRQTLLVVACSLLVSSHCQAFDFLVDAGTFTRDPVSGLRWLDVSMSQGLSYNQVNQNLGPGGLFHGWRYASVAEVIDMAGHAGVYNFGLFQAEVSEPTFDAMLGILDKFGITAVTDNGQFLRQTVTGLSGELSSGLVSAPFIDTIDYRGSQPNRASFITSGPQPTFASAGMGSWLIFTGETELGESEVTPLDGEPLANGGKGFDVASGDGFWFDPPVADLTFATDGQSQFTQIGMPSEFPDEDGLFEYSDENVSFTLASGEFMELESPVSSFTLSGLSVPEDSLTTPFAAFLRFDEPTVSFTITPVPEPAFATLFLIALIPLYRNWQRQLCLGNS